jgi:hypothetical protein
MVTSPGVFSTARTHEQATSTAETLDRLLKLDSWASPGLTEVDFRKLFVKCRHCGLVTTRRVFKDHICDVLALGDVIDLTSDMDDSANESLPVLIDLTIDSSSSE